MAVNINRKWCKKCGICVAMCPQEALDNDTEGYPFLARPEKCNQCGQCEWICPDFAVEVIKDKVNKKQREVR